MSTQTVAPKVASTGEKRSSGNQRSIMLKNYPLRFMAPAYIILVIFFFIPTFLNLFYAFTDWSAFSKTIDFNGIENFKQLFQSGTLLRDLRITLIYAILVAVFQNGFGLILAVFLEEDTRINRFARVMFFVPVIMSALAVGYIWQAILKTNGALNQILSMISGQDVTIAWLGSTTWTIVLVAAIHGWKWMGHACVPCRSEDH